MGVLGRKTRGQKDKDVKKAVLSNRIFINFDPIEAQKAEEGLTYTIPPAMPMDPPITIKTFRRIRDNLYTMPIGAQDLIPEDFEVIDKRITVPYDFPEETITLREDQQEIYDKANDSCLVNALPGWGKTYTGLMLAKKWGQKTLIVTHNTTLRAQWEQDVKDVFGIKPGVIGSGTFNTQGPIVVGNVQTLTKNVGELSRAFGTIIMDEVHHMPATTFNKLIDTSAARFKLGLSGTLERKDGRHVILPDYFSRNILVAKDRNRMTPTVTVWQSDFQFPDGAAVPWAKRVNALLYNEEYQKCVALLATQYAERGHKVLVVADRVEFLENVTKHCGEDVAVCVTGKGVKLEDRRNIERQLYDEKSILCGTTSIYKEGVSINCLSCVILATPINNDPLLEQIIGRIQRIEDEKLVPVVLDIQLKGKTATRQASQRIAHYMRKGYAITYL